MIKHKYNIGKHWYAIVQDKDDAAVEVHMISEHEPDDSAFYSIFQSLDLAPEVEVQENPFDMINELRRRIEDLEKELNSLRRKESKDA